MLLLFISFFFTYITMTTFSLWSRFSALPRCPSVATQLEYRFLLFRIYLCLSLHFPFNFLLFLPPSTIEISISIFASIVYLSSPSLSYIAASRSHSLFSNLLHFVSSACVSHLLCFSSISFHRSFAEIAHCQSCEHLEISCVACTQYISVY